VKILFLTSGPRVPSTRFRVLQYLPRLRAAGHLCIVAHSRPEKYEHWSLIGFRASQRARRLSRWLDVQRARWGRFDVVFLERELFNDPTADYEHQFRRVAKRMVLDVDDGIFLTWPDKFAKTAAMVDCVIAGSDLLAAECRRHTSRVAVVPTCVDLDRYPQKVHDERFRPTIGWTGTSSNLPYLTSIAGPLEQLARTREFGVGVISNEEAIRQLPSIPGVSVSGIPWHDATEGRDLLAFDLGVMPLPDEPWARFKCGLKLIQYMAAGLPVVASPVGVNPQILCEGQTGFLASTSDEWVVALEKLVTDVALRKRLGEAGRAVVQSRYSIAANFTAWTSAILGVPA
jgi:glycosyltransferase involved in cell wall biosynthesis